MKTNFSSFFKKIGETRAIFIAFGKISVCNERLKIQSTGWKASLMRNLTIDDGILSNAGLY